MIKSVILEDEQDGQVLLMGLLKELCPEVEVAGCADSVSLGYELILAQQPQLVFLDIKLRDGTAFQLLERLPELDFKVIFITAYDQFALKAFRFHALDYLLKPLHPEELVHAVRRVLSWEVKQIQVQALLHQLGQGEAQTRIAVPSESRVHYREIEELRWLGAEGNYTRIHLCDGTEILSSKLLKEFEELLGEHHFFRVHRSSLINLRLVREFRKVPREQVVLDDGTELDVSRHRKAAFLSAMAAV